MLPLQMLWHFNRSITCNDFSSIPALKMAIYSALLQHHSQQQRSKRQQQKSITAEERKKNRADNNGKMITKKQEMDDKRKSKVNVICWVARRNKNRPIPCRFMIFRWQNTFQDRNFLHLFCSTQRRRSHTKVSSNYARFISNCHSLNPCYMNGCIFNETYANPNRCKVIKAHVMNGF